MKNQEKIDNKPYAITLDVGSSLLNKTGSWRTMKPVYLDRLPPCNNACPAGENIQQWLYHAEETGYEKAWREIMKQNPFPAIMGRVCYHPCEESCNRGDLDQPVGINSVERFLGDQAIKFDWKIEPGKSTGKKVMIVGAGPAGLSCAYHLRRQGHEVTVYEASPKAGGMIRYGIPKYRMPREKLNVEILRVQEMGVTIEFNSPVDDILAKKKEGSFDAVFLAVGAQVAKVVDIENDGAIPILSALDVLRNSENDEPTGLNGRVIVYGGGNTAIDVARTAIRLGALDVHIITVESGEKMPAHEMEVKEALEEGVQFMNLRSIQRCEGKTLVLEKMVDTEGGWPQASGQYENFTGDVLVQALGQTVKTEPFQQIPGMVIHEGVLQVDSSMMTGYKGIFAGGDMVPSQRTATTAIGHGKKAALNINNWLNQTTYQPAPKHEIVNSSMMNTWYYSDAPRTFRPILNLVRRVSGFAEVVGNLDESNAAYEARRCMSCGNCFECDNCYGVCPDNAITKLGQGLRFEFKYDYCKGCGMCSMECPCGAIRMETESI